MNQPSISRKAKDKTLIMGIVNVTPDSFFDGGKFDDPHSAIKHAKKLVDDGADILDIGGESSRPGAEPLSAEDELKRVLPVIEILSELNVNISIDTYRAETARKAVALGASIINDITALHGDEKMVEVIAETGCECILMHMQGSPQNMQKAPNYNDVVDDICAFFENRIEYAIENGIKEHAIWLDPGFGFGKTLEHNLEILRRLKEFKRFGRPVLIGTSNKSMIGQVLDVPVDMRNEGTAATVAVGICNGADCIRVHDVNKMTLVAKMCDAIMGKKCHA